MDKDISVIIPMYNAKKTIADCVKSILFQTYNGNLEIIIIDDGSVDDCSKIVNELEVPENRLIRLIVQKNTGVSGARHAGIMMSSHSLIALCDSDDFWHKEKLVHQVEKYHQINNDCIGALIGCTQGNDIHHINKDNNDNFLYIKDNLIKWAPHPSTWLFSKELYSDVGFFNLKLTHAEDADFISRLLIRNYKVYILSKSFVGVVGADRPLWKSEGLSKDQLSMVNGEIRIATMIYQNTNEINFIQLQALKSFYYIKLILRMLNLRKFFKG